MSSISLRMDGMESRSDPILASPPDSVGSIMRVPATGQDMVESGMALLGDAWRILLGDTGGLQGRRSMLIVSTLSRSTGEQTIVGTTEATAM
jgi:hypothetical protein